MEKRMACCYYPSTVVLIDDRRRFLRTTGAKVRAQFPYKEYSHPSDALQFFKEVYRSKPFSERCTFYEKECPTDELSIHLKARLIRNEIYNPHRFDEISVVVVDFAMPNLNGIEFARVLKTLNKQIKILMLTGEAGHETATQAFSEKLIDKFLLKSMPDLNVALPAEIAALQQQYFADLSATVVQSFANRPELPASCLKDPIFMQLIDQLCEKYHLTEYYMTEGSGSYMFLNAAGKPSWLAVASESLMKEVVEIAEGSDDAVPAPILASLRNREKVLYLHTDQDLHTEPVHWSPYLHTAMKLEGLSTYYCAYIANSKVYDIQPEKVASYQAYTEKR